MFYNMCQCNASTTEVSLCTRQPQKYYVECVTCNESQLSLSTYQLPFYIHGIETDDEATTVLRAGGAIPSASSVCFCQ